MTERRARLADGGHPGVYTRPYDPDRPQVCLDEASTQLIGDARPSRTAKPRKPARHDDEYERTRTANLFVVTEPLRGWRHVEVTGGPVNWSVTTEDARAKLQRLHPSIDG